MNVTIDKSVAIYARMSHRRFGPKALERTRERIEQLARAGDLEGAKVFELVRQQIVKLEKLDEGKRRAH